MRASDEAYSRLRDDILAWRIVPGTRLNETELALSLGVSRTPLRAALARLALEGLVDTSRGRTGVVQEVSAESIRDLFELREALEVHAVKLAARRRDPQAFVLLAAGFASAPALVREGRVDDYYDMIERFDAAVDEAANNVSLRTALAGVRSHLVRARRLAADDRDRLIHAADEHRRICEAIRDGDAELAAAATMVHLAASKASILDALSPTDQETVL